MIKRMNLPEIDLTAVSKIGKIGGHRFCRVGIILGVEKGA